MPHDQMYDTLRRFAVTMADAFDIGEVLDDLGESTVEILGAAGAGVSIANDGRLEFVTSTSSDVDVVERVQHDTQDGPCVTAYRTGRVVAVSDVAAADKWPEYRRTAEQAGFMSVVGMPLVIENHRVGSLDVYDRPVRTWSDDDLEAARVLADLATAYIVRAGELGAARDLADQLQGALDSRVVIEQAKGVLSRQHGISLDSAFEMMRSYARSNNAKVRSVAHDVVDGAIDLGDQLVDR